MPPRKQVEVFHELNGEMRRMNFDILSVSQQVHTPSNFSYSPLQGSVHGGCSNGSQLSSHAARTVTFHTYMRQPQAPEPCWASYSWAPVNHVDNSEVTQMGVSFLLDIPPPYRLAAGIYRGSLTYSIGPGGDFDFGSGVTALSGDSLTVNFVLDVQHAFIFEFPPGSSGRCWSPKTVGRHGWAGQRRRRRCTVTCRSGCGRPGLSRSTKLASTRLAINAASVISTTIRFRWRLP